MKALLFLMTVLCVAVDAQNFTAGTVYSNHHDYVPDTLLWYRVTPYTNNTFSMNIFGTNTQEIEFTARGSVSSGGSQAFIRLRSLRADIYMRFGRYDSVWVPGDNDWNVTKVARALISGEVINSTDAVWEKSGDLYLTDHSGSGGGNKNVYDFVGGDKYIGLRFDEQNTYGVTQHFGWIWVRCVSNDSCYVKAYSASARVSAVDENRTGSLLMYPNPAGTRVFLQHPAGQSLDPAGMTVRNAFGKLANCKVSVAHNGLEVDMQDVVPGVYFVSFETDQGRMTGKLVKAE